MQLRIADKQNWFVDILNYFSAFLLWEKLETWKMYLKKTNVTTRKHMGNTATLKKRINVKFCWAFGLALRGQDEIKAFCRHFSGG